MGLKGTYSSDWYELLTLDVGCGTINETVEVIMCKSRMIIVDQLRQFTISEPNIMKGINASMLDLSNQVHPKYLAKTETFVSIDSPKNYTDVTR